MGRPRVNRTLPPYASDFRDRHGRMRVRFRKTGLPTLYPKALPGTDDFWKEYLAWKNGLPAPIGRDRHEAGTFDDLINQFYRSTPWNNIPKESTKATYRGELERFRATYGKRKVATMSAKNVTRLMEKMAATPSAASNLLKRLRTLFDYSIVLGMRTDNPAKPVKAPRTTSKGFHEWTEEEIDQFKERHPVGTKARLALEIFLCTAQRRSDAATMGEHPKRPGIVKVRQLKTDALLTIRMHRDLKAAVAACPSGKPTFLISERGTPFTKESLGNWFRERCDEAGLPQCAAHGLRKAASRRLAEIGLSNQTIKAITGHTTDSEVARYTAGADQEKLAEAAMDALEASSLSNSGKSVSQTSSENGGNQPEI
jgi:site-specific recombinase XerD